MTKELVRRVDDFVEKNLPWWEKDEDCNTCEGVSAKSILETLDDWLSDDFNLKHDIYLEACKETLEEDKSWFNDADTGYCPSMVICNLDDVYLGKGWRFKELNCIGSEALEDSAYYLADCWEDPTNFIKVIR